MTDASARAMTITLPAKLRNVALVGISVRAICCYELFTFDEAALLELAVCEALNNSIHHSLQERPGESITLAISVWPDRISFTIRDGGAQVPENLYARPPHPEEALATSGRGVFIMHGIMDLIRYERSEGHNILIMEKRVGRPLPNIP